MYLFGVQLKLNLRWQGRIYYSRTPNERGFDKKKLKKPLGDVMIIINFVVYDRLSMYNLIIRVRKIINYLIRDYITKVQSHLIILRHYHIKRRNYFHVYSLFKQPYVKILTMLLLKYGVNPYNNS